RGPQVVGRRLVEDELAVVGPADGELAIEVELEVLGEAQIELEIRRRYAVRALAAHQAELHVELGDTGLLQLHVRRLEHATHGDRARDAGDQQEAGGGE